MSNGPTDKGMIARCTERKAAATKYITGPITVRQKTYTPQAIVAAYQGPIDARSKLKAARASVASSLAARAEADAAMEAQDEIVQSWVDATFGPKSQEAVDFGYAARRDAHVTATEKVEAAQKAKVTRQALGTKGKKQKKQAKKQLASAAVAPPAPPAPTPPTLPKPDPSKS